MRWWWVVVTVACSKGEEKRVAVAPPPPASDAATWDSQEQVPRAVGPVTRIRTGETVIVGGVRITFDEATHTMGGRTVGHWYFTLAHEGLAPQTVSFDSHRGHPVFGEAGYAGVGFAFQHVKYEIFDIVLLGTGVDALDEDTCVARIREAAARAGLEPGDTYGQGGDNGFISFTSHANGWQGWCGPYSQRVWLQRPRPRP